MLKGDYYPDFTAAMMLKDIELGLALGEKYGVPQDMNAFVAAKYKEAMSKYGDDSGSSIPCRLVEDASGIQLQENPEAHADHEDNRYPGNRLDPGAHGGAFKDWSYSTGLCDGSYTIKHTGYDNAYLTTPWTTHAGPDEMMALRMRVAELEAQLAEKQKQ